MSAQRQQVRRSPSAISGEGIASSIERKISETDPVTVPETVPTRVAARIVGRSPDTLKRWRYEGVGPEYIVYRRRVRYDVRVLIRFNGENTRMPSVRAAMEAERERF